ncbi:MAG: YIP1 family protein [Thermoleophilia bacterium]|nr:YIP1 family protein [Thermoleophilia bacterium]
MSDEAAAAGRSREAHWWLRALAALTSPRSAFVGIRDDSEREAEARAEPVLALTLLAGIAGVLATPSVGNLLDSPERDALVVAVLVFLSGTLYGAATYWLGGGAVALGIRAAGGRGSYRQARHILAFAAAPLALSLLVLLPLRFAAYGADLFRSGGADETASSRWAFDALQSGFFLWAAALLVVGVRTVYAWPVVRTLGALVLALLALYALALVLQPSLAPRLA